MRRSTNATTHGEPSGLVRTLKVGDRIKVFGDLVVVAVEGRRVQVRLVGPSPSPEPVMFPVNRTTVTVVERD